MKALTTAGLTKLIQLIKSSFISTSDTVTTNTVTLADVATSGDYDDLSNKPIIGDGTITFTQGGVTKGTITTNQSGNATIDLDAGGGGEVPTNILAFNNDANYVTLNQFENPLTVTNKTGQAYPYVTINSDNFSLKGDVSTSLTKNETTLQLFTFSNGKIDTTKHIVMDFQQRPDDTDSYNYGNYTTIQTFADTPILGKMINGVFTPKIYLTSDTIYEVSAVESTNYSSGITTYTLTTNAIGTISASASGADLVTILLKAKNASSPSWRLQVTANANSSQLTYETIWTNSTTSYEDLLAYIDTVIFVENTTNIPVRCVGEWEQALYYTPTPLRTVANMSTIDMIGLSTSFLDNYVTLTDAQTISGVKYFSNGLKVLGEVGIKDNNDVTFIRTNPNLTSDGSYVWEIGSIGARLQDFKDIYMTTTRGSYINIDANNITNYLPTINQIYNGTSANAQSGVAIERELTTNYQSKLVSGTNIKTVNNISLLGNGNIDTSEVFVAEFNVTSYADVQTAYNAGKTIYCLYTDTSNNEYIMWLNYVTQTYFDFYSSKNGDLYITRCNSTGNTWELGYFNLEVVSNKVTSISSSSTDTQYPSAKCVYDELTDKADVDLTNCTKPHIIETYSSGTSWYRVYSDGWCEQGGVTGTESTTRGQTIGITFVKQFTDTNYTIVAIDGNTSKSNYSGSVGITTVLNGTKSTSGVSIASYGFQSADTHGVINWVAFGYLS